VTAPSGPILFNNLTGSDTTDSGLGPATSVNGAGASTTASSAVVTGIDTTGVSAGDLLYVDSTSGRKFSIIASVDSATQATCDDTFDNTEASRNWGIGGKRATLESSQAIFDDPKGGWVIDIEETGTDYQLTGATITASGDTTNGYVTYKSSSATKPIISLENPGTAAWILGISANAVRFEGLAFSHETNNTVVNGLVAGATTTISFMDCDFTQVNSTQNDHALWFSVNSTVCDVRVQRCVFHDVGGLRFNFTQAITGILVENNRFADMRVGYYSTSAIYIEDVRGAKVVNNIIADASGNGIEIVGKSDGAIIEGNVVVDSGGDGIEIGCQATVKRNILQGNGAYGIHNADTHHDDYYVADWNAFRNNTSGETSGIASGDNDITLTADPFVDASSDDFNINDTAGGGTVLRAATVTMP